MNNTERFAAALIEEKLRTLGISEPTEEERYLRREDARIRRILRRGTFVIGALCIAGLSGCSTVSLEKQIDRERYQQYGEGFYDYASQDPGVTPIELRAFRNDLDAWEMSTRD